MAQQSTIVNDRYKIKTPSGFKSFSGIMKQEKTGIVTITTQSGLTVDCTFDHKIKSMYGFVEAKDIMTDDKIVTKNGYEKVVHVFYDRQQTIDVYDPVDVKDGNEYYSNDIVSHNCEFLGSSGTLIDGPSLKALVMKHPLTMNDNLYIYENPIKENTYVSIVDVSRGKGLDYSASQIIDITKMPYKQVAVFRDNHTTPVEYAEILNRIGRHYNDAATLVEVNDIGEQVSTLMHDDYEYENLLSTESAGRAGKKISTGFSRGSDLGIKTTKTVKSIGCSVLKMLIEQQQLIVNDFETISELSTFSKRGHSYEAEPGRNDDLVMCLVLFAWLSSQKYFKELTDINTMAKLREKTEEEIMSDLLPFGIVEDGNEDIDSERMVVVDRGDDSWLGW